MRVQAARIRQQPDTRAAKLGFLRTNRGRSLIEYGLKRRDSQERHPGWLKTPDLFLKAFDALRQILQRQFVGARRGPIHNIRDPVAPLEQKFLVRRLEKPVSKARTV